MKKAALLSVLLVLVAIPALATPADYMTLKLGAYSPRHSDLKDDYSTGFNGEGAIGHYFHPNIALEFSVGYFETKASGNGVGGKFSAVPFLLNVKGVIPMARGEIYALAGGGFYMATGQASALGIPIKDTNTTAGWQVGIGGNYNLSETVFLGLEGKYLWAKYKVPGISTSVTARLDGIQATANIGYRW